MLNPTSSSQRRAPIQVLPANIAQLLRREFPRGDSQKIGEVREALLDSVSTSRSLNALVAVQRHSNLALNMLPSRPALHSLREQLCTDIATGISDRAVAIACRELRPGMRYTAIMEHIEQTRTCFSMLGLAFADADDVRSRYGAALRGAAMGAFAPPDVAQIDDLCAVVASVGEGTWSNMMPTILLLRRLSEVPCHTPDRLASEINNIVAHLPPMDLATLDTPDYKAVVTEVNHLIAVLPRRLRAAPFQKKVLEAPFSALGRALNLGPIAVELAAPDTSDDATIAARMQGLNVRRR